MSFSYTINNAHFDFIVQFEQEGKAIPFKCWSEENKIHVKLNIEGSGTLTASMDLDYASIFIKEAIPLIMEQEATLIKEYLN